MTAVLAVPAGNPRHLHTLKDVLDGNVKLALAEPGAAAIGLLTKRTLEKAGRWDALNKKKHVNKVTVTDVANDVKLGTVDAGIIWDATVRQYDGALEAVALPELKDASSHISVGVLRSSDRPASALHSPVSWRPATAV